MARQVVTATSPGTLKQKPVLSPDAVRLLTALQPVQVPGQSPSHVHIASATSQVVRLKGQPPLMQFTSPSLTISIRSPFEHSYKHQLSVPVIVHCLSAYALPGMAAITTMLTKNILRIFPPFVVVTTVNPRIAATKLRYVELKRHIVAEWSPVQNQLPPPH